VARRRGGGPVRRRVGRKEWRPNCGCRSKKRMHIELQTCLKPLKRTQRATGSVRDRRRAWRPRRSSSGGGASVARAEDGSGEE
jgi:hypothetical protein